MRTFTDSAGRTWTVTINVSAIKRVRDLLNVDLLEVLDGKLIKNLCRDPVLLCDVVYAVCKPEADAKGVSDEDFGRAMAGDAIDHATKALLEELAGFSPSPKDRANLMRALTMIWGAMDKARDLVEAELAKLDADKIAMEAWKKSGGPSGGAPESSA